MRRIANLTVANKGKTETFVTHENMALDSGTQRWEVQSFVPCSGDWLAMDSETVLYSAVPVSFDNSTGAASENESAMIVCYTANDHVHADNKLCVASDVTQPAIGVGTDLTTGQYGFDFDFYSIIDNKDGEIISDLIAFVSIYAPGNKQFKDIPLIKGKYNYDKTKLDNVSAYSYIRLSRQIPVTDVPKFAQAFISRVGTDTQSVQLRIACAEGQLTVAFMTTHNVGRTTTINMDYNTSTVNQFLICQGHNNKDFINTIEQIESDLDRIDDQIEIIDEKIDKAAEILDRAHLFYVTR